MVVLSVFMREKYFFALKFSCSGCSHHVHSISLKSRKRLVNDHTDSFATNAGLVHDVKDTHRQTQNGSAQVCVFKFEIFIFNQSVIFHSY